MTTKRVCLSSNRASAKNDSERARATISKLRADAVKVLSSAEDERAEMARTIHDGLGQKLTALSLEVSLWKTELEHVENLSPIAIRKKLAVFSDLVDSVIGSTQRLTASLSPRVLTEFGLSAALEWHLEKVEKQTGVACAFTSDCQKIKIQPFEAAQIFRIASEIIASCINADCKRIRATLLAQKRVLLLLFEVAPTERALPPATRARIGLLGGKIQLNPGKKKVVLSLPRSFVSGPILCKNPKLGVDPDRGEAAHD